ncbi:hypothetical protein [Enterobacter sp. 638]|uniref:Uncharacterized protein n=1 Tax=Enterobacter sp. (strain 638) TaxID=399742 RepID=A0A9J9GF00_ENT38|nr:hypothetical protein [Enterobacter sp. 638]ABP59710.1 hypothetical protein Ent638_1028 [Enterobacter sp. 638]
MSQLLAVGGEWIAGLLGIVVLVFAAWFGGKSKGTTETQAKADVKEANAETQQSQAVTEKQTETIKVVKSVEQANQSMSDNAARDSMRGSKYHAKD